jgi:hypothetical protein
MELISNAPTTQDLNLTEDQTKELVSYIAMQWDKGQKEREPYKEKWDLAKDAYEAKVKDEENRRKVFRSSVALPWTYTAIESWKSFLISQMWAYDIERFNLKPVADDDTKGCDVMQTFLNVKVEEAQIYFALTQAIHDLSFGHCVLKVSWLKDESTNNVHYENISMEDFMFYPIVGDVNKSTRIQRLWMFYEDLIATHEQLGEDSPYINLDKLEPKDNDSQATPIDWSSKDCHKHREGIEIKEAWIHHVRLKADGGKTLRNIVATVAKGKHLIRIGANTYPQGKAPFIQTCLIQDGHNNLGWGLTSMAQKVQSTANELISMRLDNVKKTQNAMFKYVEDQIFDANKFISRPGALIEVGTLDNLQPIDSNPQVLQNLIQEVESLKNEFEEATMPRSIRGQLDQIQRTATESNNLQQNASTSITQHAKRINEKILKPLIEWTYLLTTTRLEEDPELKLQMARITQNTRVPTRDEQGNPVMDPNNPKEVLMYEKKDEELIAELPKFLPLSELDVKIIGYENQQQRDKKAFAFQNFMPLFLQSPASKYANIDNMAEESLVAMGLDPKTLLVDDEKRRQADQAEQATAQAQQDAQNQIAMLNIDIQKKALEIQQMQVQMKNQTDTQKIQNDFAVNLLKIELEEQKAQVDVNLEPQQAQLQGMMTNANTPPTAPIDQA